MELEHLFFSCGPLGGTVKDARIFCIRLSESIDASDALDLNRIRVLCLRCFAVRRAPVTSNTSCGDVVVNVYNLINSVCDKVRIMLAN